MPTYSTKITNSHSNIRITAQRTTEIQVRQLKQNEYLQNQQRDVLFQLGPVALPLLLLNHKLVTTNPQTLVMNTIFTRTNNSREGEKKHGQMKILRYS